MRYLESPTPVLDLLFPRRCPVCDRPVKPFGALICGECAKVPQPVGDSVCCKCGKPVAREDEYCAEATPEILRKVLQDYDLATDDFLSWTVRYSRAALSDLVKRRTGIDFVEIKALEAVERGPSGRIKYLRISGSKKTEVIGKELAIRRALSESHLKSSAFDVEWDGDECILRGRGWGHGVGLCQIGAAVMASKGIDCAGILAHY